MFTNTLPLSLDRVYHVSQTCDGSRFARSYCTLRLLLNVWSSIGQLNESSSSVGSACCFGRRCDDLKEW
jgi:hypothetical protein